MEEVTRCIYINCNDDQETGQIFHELPVCNVGLCVKWLVNSGHEDLVGKDFATLQAMRFFICNKHFNNNSYLTKGTLKENAVPRPYWSCVRKEKNDDNQNRYTPDRYTTTELYKNNKEMNGHSEKENSITMSDNFDVVHSVEQWCRTCARRKNDLVSMTMKDKQTEMSLLSKLKLLIEIDDEDILPLNMCRECVAKLEQSFQFFQQIYIADNTLRHIFPSVNTKYDSHNIHDIHDEESMRNCTENKSWNAKNSDNCSMRDYNSVIMSNGATENQCSESITKSNSETLDEHKEDNTAFSLLVDTNKDNEELRWMDVLNVIKETSDTNVKSDIYCEFCSAKFQQKYQLKTHLIISHSTLAKNMCKNCLVCYENKSLLTKHRVHYHKEKGYVCDYCKEIFLRKNKLEQHIKSLHLEKEKYPCDACNEQFNSEELLYEHMKVDHTNRDIEFHDVNNESPSSKTQPKCSVSVECQRKNNMDCQCRSCSKFSANITTDSIPIENNENKTSNAISSKTEEVEESVESRVDVSILGKPNAQKMHCQSTKEKDLTCSCNEDCFCSLGNQKECVDYQCEKPKMCV